MQQIPISNQPRNIFKSLVDRQYGRLSEDWIQDRVVSNIQHGRCFKTIFQDEDGCSHKDLIQSLYTFQSRQVVGGEYAITLDQNKKFKCWDLKTGECLWKCDTFSRLGYQCQFLPTEKKIVCQWQGEDFTNRFQLIDLTDGQKDPAEQIPAKQIYPVGKSIFGMGETGNPDFYEWDAGGRTILRTNLGPQLDVKLFGSEKFIIQSGKKWLGIYNMENQAKKYVDLSILDSKIDSISTFHFSGSLLYCGFSTGKVEGPSTAFCAVDLEKGEAIAAYQIDSHHVFENEVDAMLVDGDIAYLGHSSGKVFMINLVTRKVKNVGEHRNSIGVSYLALENRILISGSKEHFIEQAELKFWDTRSMKQIKAMKFPSLRGIACVAGKVLVAVDKYLVQWDFNCLHVGEILTSNSAKEATGMRDNPDLPNPSYDPEQGSVCSVQ